MVVAILRTERESLMAKKARKQSAAKAKKKAKPVATKKRRPVAKKKVARKAKRKTKRQTVGDRLSNAYRTVLDTAKGTDQLRNKLEPPGTSETE
jgi:Ni/Co efflux regulator RcnB